MGASRLLGSTWRNASWYAPALTLVLPLVAFATDAQAQTPTQLASRTDAQVTYAKDVALIIQQNCQTCHQVGGIGPMALTNYEEVRPWAALIKNAVVNRVMPPYQYDSDVGIQHLKNDWRLTDAEIATIAAWVDAGAPLGNAADLPAPLAAVDYSKFRLEDYFGRPPDVIVRSTPYTVPGFGSDRWWRPSVPSGITESRCIAGVETKPSLASRTVAHHANTSFRGGTVDLPQATASNSADADADARGGNDPNEAASQLSEYAMGKIGEIIPPDACRRAPADGQVSFDIHYYPNGDEVVDAVVEVGIWLHPADHSAKYQQNLTLYGTQSGSGDLEIAPQGTLMTEGMTVWDHPVRIDSWQPHGHLRLVGAKLEVLDPSNGRKTLLSMVSNWSAGWHHSHVYEDDAAPLIPAGHILVRTQWYDNTDQNATLRVLGGDPDMWVGTGDRTADEMSHQWIAVTHLDQPGYEALLAERQANQPPAQQGARGAGANN